jgi:hypothetical protein
MGAHHPISVVETLLNLPLANKTKKILIEPLRGRAAKYLVLSNYCFKKSHHM